MSLNVNCGLWVLMMCQCMFINCNKWTTLVGDDNGGDWACMETGGVWEISVHFPQFCCERKTALKNIVLKIYSLHSHCEFRTMSI